MSTKSQWKNTANTVCIAVTATGILLVTAVLALLLRENGSYSTDSILVLGGLGVAIIGLLVMAIDRAM